MKVILELSDYELHRAIKFINQFRAVTLINNVKGIHDNMKKPLEFFDYDNADERSLNDIKIMNKILNQMEEAWNENNS